MCWLPDFTDKFGSWSEIGAPHYNQIDAVTQGQTDPLHSDGLVEYTDMRFTDKEQLAWGDK